MGARRGAAPQTTDLPVILPLAARLRVRDAFALPVLRLSPWLGAGLAALIVLSAAAADAAGGPAAPGVFAVLARWTPELLTGFGFNILISFVAMGSGTLLGVLLGLGLIALSAPVRGSSWLLMQFFRNAPWLVLLFFMILIIPFHASIGPVQINMPGWIKAVIGLALPVMANVAEIMRGAVRSIPPGQWEASSALGFTRRQQLWLIILPQCVKRMIPPWMNLYSILTTSTTLASIVGVTEVVSLAERVLAAEGGRTDLLAPVYGYVLLMFFLYTYPITLLTQRLERRYAVKL